MLGSPLQSSSVEHDMGRDYLLLHDMGVRWRLKGPLLLVPSASSFLIAWRQCGVVYTNGSRVRLNPSSALLFGILGELLSFSVPHFPHL